jgi:cytochrome P450 monooxygenase
MNEPGSIGEFVRLAGENGHGTDSSTEPHSQDDRDCREEVALTTSEELPSLVQDRPSLLGVNEHLRSLQAKHPVMRVLTPAGDVAWLVTRQSDARRLLRDRRIGRAHKDPENAPKYVDNPMMKLLTESVDFDTEHDVHQEMRGLLTPYFAGRFMNALQPRLAKIVDRWVDHLASLEPPVNLVKEFSQPLTLDVISELLGVPESERAEFPALVNQMSSVDDTETAEGGRNTVFGYFTELAARRRAEPTDDVMSGLTQSGVDDFQTASLALMILFAAFGSTSNHISLGVARMSIQPEIRQELIEDPDLMPGAVEEFLRTASTGGFTLPHYAREEVEVGDVVINPGDLVLMDYGLANFDENAFEDPDRVDITRQRNAHMAFAHGMWNCVGAPLARMVLRMAFNALLERLPEIRLNVPLEEVERMSGAIGGGLEELPVTW